MEAGAERLTGVILAGGASRRMGVDKALIEVGGRALVLRVLDRIAPVCRSVLVASGDGRRLSHLHVPQIADAFPGAGPLAGVLAGLRAATTPLVAVVAVDMPDASGAVLDALASWWAPGTAAVVPVVEGRRQPLHAVWATAAAPDLERLVTSGARSVNAALAALPVRDAGSPVWGPVDPGGRFARNLNRPEDLERPR